MPPSEAQRRANAKQNKKRAEIEEAKRTPIWLDPATLKVLDKKRGMTGETRVAFVRRLILEIW